MKKENRKLQVNGGNLDRQVIKGFGEEWTRFSQDKLTEIEQSAIFNNYFSNFPWAELPSDAHGADIGCGSGRWATVVAPRVGRLTCIDASPEALEVARRNLSEQGNVICLQADVAELPFINGELDFAYSLGVLHHVPNTESALANVAKALKSGAPFLVYLYYAFDNRPLWFRMLWKLSNSLRQLICRLPSPIRFAACDTVAALIYWPLARLAKVLAILRARPRNFPLAYYSDKSFYVMRTDALDRFGTRLEKRFSRAQIATMLEVAGFHNIKFGAYEPFWCAIARRR